MVKTLQKHGNSQALVTLSGNSLIIKPVHAGIGREKVEEMIDALRPRYGEMLKRLAE